MNRDSRQCTVAGVDTMIPHEDNLLTFDEKRAAEAAFRGLPIDPTWSQSAQVIYHGILMRTYGRNIIDEAIQEELAVF